MGIGKTKPAVPDLKKIKQEAEAKAEEAAKKVAQQYEGLGGISGDVGDVDEEPPDLRTDMKPEPSEHFGPVDQSKSDYGMAGMGPINPVVGAPKGGVFAPSFKSGGDFATLDESQQNMKQVGNRYFLIGVSEFKFENLRGQSFKCLGATRSKDEAEAVIREMSKTAPAKLAMVAFEYGGKKIYMVVDRKVAHDVEEFLSHPMPVPISAEVLYPEG